MYRIVPYIVGYIFSLGVAQAIIYPLMLFLYKKTGDVQTRKITWLAAWVGVIERLLVTTSVLVDKYEIIAVWVVMKAAASWKAENSKSLSGFYIALIGTGLSLLFGILGGLIILQFDSILVFLGIH